MDQPTEQAQLLAMLERAGVRYVTGKAAADRALLQPKEKICLNGAITVPHTPGHRGYSGFYAYFQFDESGQLQEFYCAED